MAKPEFLIIPDGLSVDLQKAHRKIRHLSELQLGLFAEFRLSNLLEFDGLPNPGAAYENLRDYMISTFEIFRRKAGMNADPVTREQIGEILLNFWGVFQTNQEDTARAMIDFCKAQMNHAKTNNDQPTFHKWSLVQQSLQQFV